MTGVTELRRRRRRLRRSYLGAVCCVLCSDITKLVALFFVVCPSGCLVFLFFIIFVLLMLFMNLTVSSEHLKVIF